jgi:hypothetical protein
MTATTAADPTCCSICCGKYTRAANPRLRCPNAACDSNVKTDEGICTSCAKRATLEAAGAQDPHCMRCRRGWTLPDLFAMFSQSWVRGKYAEHRMNTLAERQRAMLPGDQAAAEDHVRAKRLEALVKHLKSTLLRERGVLLRQRKGLREQWVSTKKRPVSLSAADIASERARVQVAKAHNAPIMAEIRRLEARAADLLAESNRQLNAFYAEGRLRNRGDDAAAAAAAAPMATFPCPRDACNAFIVVADDAARRGGDGAAAAVCGICSARVCATCREEIAAAADSAPHACDPDTVASVAALARDTKPCPKCAVPIFKVSGCPQMMCTACHTIFSWDTLKIQVGGVIHNPHYYEWRRRQHAAGAAADAAAGAAGDAGCGDGAQILMDARLNRIAITEVRLSPFVRRIRHISDVRRQQVVGNDEFRELRIRHLAGELSLREWKLRMLRAERLAEWRAANAQLLDTFVLAVKDILVMCVFGDNGGADRAARVEIAKREMRAIAGTLNAEAELQAAAHQRNPKQRLHFVVEHERELKGRWDPPRRTEALDVATEDRLCSFEGGVFWRI